MREPNPVRLDTITSVELIQQSGSLVASVPTLIIASGGGRSSMVSKTYLHFETEKQVAYDSKASCTHGSQMVSASSTDFAPHLARAKSSVPCMHAFMMCSSSSICGRGIVVIVFQMCVGSIG